MAGWESNKASDKQRGFLHVLVKRQRNWVVEEVNAEPITAYRRNVMLSRIDPDRVDLTKGQASEWIGSLKSRTLS